MRKIRRWVTELLDKLVLQYSKDGVVERNIATGESRLVAESDYEKESKLEIPAQESQYNSPYSLSAKTIYLHSTTPSHLKSGSPQVAQKPYGRADRAMKYYPVGTQIHGHAERCSPTYNKTGAALIPVSESRRENRSLNTYQEEEYYGSGKAGEAKYLRSENEKVFHRVFQEENALPGIKKATVNPKVKKRNFLSKSYFLRRFIRKFNRGQSGANNDEDNLGIQTVRAASRISDRLLHGIQQIKKFNRFIIKHPATAKFFLAIAGVFVGILLLSMLFCWIGGGLFGSVTEHPELDSYVQQLDNDFPNKINSVIDTYEKKGYEVTVEGDESIFTDPGALAILATKDWTNIELTPANKSLLDKCHSILNYYTVTSYDESVVKGTSKDVTHHVIILIHTCTAEERIDAFGFDAKTKSYVLEMLNILHQIENETGMGSASKGNVSAAVLAYRSVVEQYCKQYGIQDYVNLVLAVMQQESGGSGKDPMQASECGYNRRFLHYPNSITDPSYSIECGVEELADCLRAAKCNSSSDMQGISLALQGYNFGNGFITWAQQRGGYSLANAVAFSKMEAQKEGWSSYGDVNYVSHVLRYYNAIQNGGNFIWPVTGYTDLSSGYGPRIDPTTGKSGSFHAGIDIPAPAGTPICAAASGTVIYAQFGVQPYGGYGNLVVIKNSASLVTLYGHCSKLLVSVGQTVQQGQKIALVGSTGDSTGNHCHFEVRVNGTHTDPMPYFQSRH